MANEKWSQFNQIKSFHSLSLVLMALLYGNEHKVIPYQRFYSLITPPIPIMIKPAADCESCWDWQVESPLEFGCLSVLKTRLTWMWNKWSRKVALDTFRGTISRPGYVSQWHPDTKRHKDFFCHENRHGYVYWLIRKLALWNCFPVHAWAGSQLVLNEREWHSLWTPVLNAN